MKESISFDKGLREAVKETTKILAKAVKSTLGPSGTNVGVLSQLRLPIIVNDGVTVAKSIKFEQDTLENFVANSLKTISQNTDNLAGDGTSTSITLAEAIILEGIKNIDAGFSPIDLAKGIRKACLMTLEKLEKIALPVKEENLLEVASISANNDKELGKIISEAFLKVGVDGQIEVKDSLDDKTYLETISGMKFDSGFESNMFINTDSDEVHLEDCKIFIYEGTLKSTEPIMPIIQDSRNKNLPVLLICDSYDEVCVDDLASFKVQHKVKICAVKSPSYGKEKEGILDDLAFVTGAQIISKRFGNTIDKCDVSMLGESDSVKVDKDSFTLLKEVGDKKELTKKIENLKKSSKKTKGTEKDEISSRIARLSNGVAALYVSGDSPAEISEKKYRIEDAIGATRASLEQGVVPGGGITLLKIGKSLKMPILENRDQEIGFNILVKALEAPIKTISENSGVNGEVVISEVLKKENFNYGYNAKTKEYVDLMEDGVIDPLKVTKTALTNAASVSQLLLTMNTCIYK